MLWWVQGTELSVVVYIGKEVLLQHRFYFGKWMVGRVVLDWLGTCMQEVHSKEEGEDRMGWGTENCTHLVMTWLFRSKLCLIVGSDEVWLVEVYTKSINDYRDMNVDVPRLVCGKWCMLCIIKSQSGGVVSICVLNRNGQSVGWLECSANKGNHSGWR